MPLRNGKPLTFKPLGLSDTEDATNAPSGAMAVLQDLVPSQSTRNSFVCRPAAVQLTTFSGFTTPKQVVCLLVIGDIAYGMIQSSDFTGKDVPFAYNITSNTFYPISGEVSANLPATQATTGDWVPPTAAMVGGRVIFTHPGFPGAPSGPYFGWLDLTGYTNTTLTGNVIHGSNVIQSISGDGLSTPILDGVQPGQTLTAGSLFPSGTVVVGAMNGTTDISTTGDTNGSDATVQSIPSTTGMRDGMYVSGVNIPVGAYILTVDSSSQITLNANTLGSHTGGAINVTGGGTITVNNNATGSTTPLQPLSISGGTSTAPLWGSGNLNGYPLVAVPAAVAQFNNRAYFAVGNAVAFSDILNPLNSSNANQVLTLGDDTIVTALSGLPLSNQVTGGILQSLIAFKGAGIMFQITGDYALETLALDAIAGSVGTLAPNSICATPFGLAYIAPDGMRILSLTAQCSTPIGAFGDGVCVPFISAIAPTRMAAAYNQNVYRISVQNGGAPGQPVQEYWYDFALKIWTGPHTFPAGLIESYTAPAGAEAGFGFVLAASGINAKLWQSGAVQVASSTFIENGNQLNWVWNTALLPDNAAMAMNDLNQTTLDLAIPSGQDITVISADENGDILGTVTIAGAVIPGTVWGSFTWGSATWGSSGGNYEQTRVSWSAPVVFKQMSIRVTGVSDADFAIGNLYMRYQVLGYLLDR